MYCLWREAGEATALAVPYTLLDFIFLNEHSLRFLHPMERLTSDLEKLFTDLV